MKGISILAVVLWLFIYNRYVIALRGDLIEWKEVQSKTSAEMGDLLNLVLPLEIRTGIEDSIMKKAFQSDEKNTFGFSQYHLTYKSLNPRGEEFNAKATSTIGSIHTSKGATQRI